MSDSLLERDIIEKSLDGLDTLQRNQLCIKNYGVNFNILTPAVLLTDVIVEEIEVRSVGHHRDVGTRPIIEPRLAWSLEYQLAAELLPLAVGLDEGRGH